MNCYALVCACCQATETEWARALLIVGPFCSEAEADAWAQIMRQIGQDRVSVEIECFDGSDLDLLLESHGGAAVSKTMEHAQVLKEVENMAAVSATALDDRIRNSKFDLL